MWSDEFRLTRLPCRKTASVKFRTECLREGEHEKKKTRSNFFYVRTMLTAHNIMSLDNILTDGIVHSIVISIDFQWVRQDSATTSIGRKVSNEIIIINLYNLKIIIL